MSYSEARSEAEAVLTKLAARQSFRKLSIVDEAAVELTSPLLSLKRHMLLPAMAMYLLRWQRTCRSKCLVVEQA